MWAPPLKSWFCTISAIFPVNLNYSGSVVISKQLLEDLPHWNANELISVIVVTPNSQGPWMNYVRQKAFMQVWAFMAYWFFWRFLMKFKWPHPIIICILWISSIKGLGTVSINIGPVLTQKLKLRHLQFFLVGIICSVLLVYRSDICFGKCTCVLWI